MKSTEEIEIIFRKNGLYAGRMISGSKSGYRMRNPDNDVLFNANIFTKEQHKVWWGDLDITLDNGVLQKICDEIGVEMIVVSEMMGRFGAEERTYDEIEKNAHTKFIPESKTYLERVYDGIEFVTIDKMMILSSKGIDWIKRKVKRKRNAKTNIN